MARSEHILKSTGSKKAVRQQIHWIVRWTGILGSSGFCGLPNGPFNARCTVNLLNPYVSCCTESSYVCRTVVYILVVELTESILAVDQVMMSCYDVNQ